jgi:hypothetical protein
MSRRAFLIQRALGTIAVASNASVAVAVAGGCGRRATDADCQLIVDRSVELQMKEMSESDARAIAEREAQVRAALGDEIRSCESRRVTDKTIACVRSASTSKELDSCLR